MTDELEKLQRKGTKPRHCCYGVRPLSDCQCEKDRLAALDAEPSYLECQSEIDKDLVRSYYGDLGAFYRVRAALAATPAAGEGEKEITRHIIGHLEANCGLSFFDVKPEDWQIITNLVLALPASPLRGRDEDWRDDPSADERWNAGVDCAMKLFCDYLGVDPNAVTWDAATETVDGDVRAVIGNILRAKMGEDWSPFAVQPASPLRGRKPDEWELAKFLCEKLALEDFDEMSRTKYLGDAKAILEFLSASPPEQPASPLRGRELSEDLALADYRDKAYERLHALCGTRNDAPNWSDIECVLRERDELYTQLRASPPEQPAAGCGDPSCNDPDCTYGKGTNYLAQPAAEMFRCNCPHEVRSGCSELQCPHYTPPRTEQPAGPNNHAFTLNTPMTRFSNQRPAGEHPTADPVMGPEWQPMNLAPKDAEIIGQDTDGRVFNMRWDPDDCGENWYDLHGDQMAHPVRWMPMPTAAKETK